MSNPGFVDLDVRYVSSSLGVGLAVDSIEGEVYSADGALIDKIVPDPIVDSFGIKYVKSDYDVRDLSKYGGPPFVTVVWIAKRAGVLLPDFTKQYWIEPAGREYTNQTVLMWKPPDLTDGPVIFYEVYRRRGEEDPIFAGRSIYPLFIDETVFTNEFEARSYKYYLNPAVHVEGELQADGSDYVVRNSQIVPDQIFRTGLPVCVIEGSLRDLYGRSARQTTSRGADTYVVFRQNWRDRFQLRGDVFFAPEDVYAFVHETDGKFAAPLVQGVVTEIEILSWNYRGRFVVPALPRIGLGSLDVTLLRE
jgi:hypothetical protein